MQKHDVNKSEIVEKSDFSKTCPQGGGGNTFAHVSIKA